MLELPEAVVLAEQISQTLQGKRIVTAVANQSPLKFAWYTGDPAEYGQRPAGKIIGTAAAYGNHVEIKAGDMLLLISAPLRYHAQGEKLPKKHQLVLEFADGAAASASIQMWGVLFCFRAGEKGGLADYHIAKARPSPLDDVRQAFCATISCHTRGISTMFRASMAARMARLFSASDTCSLPTMSEKAPSTKAG